MRTQTPRELKKTFFLKKQLPALASKQHENNNYYVQFDEKFKINIYKSKRNLIKTYLLSRVSR